LRNADLPTRTADGTLLRRPQAALDLHYLFTFYGKDKSLEQQRLLGFVVRQFHAFPTLANDQIVAAQNGNSFLNQSDLSEQVELVQLTPINFSLEELSKLWSVFLKTDYVLSVAYKASVVLIETDDVAPATALPVLSFNVQAVPFSFAVIESIQPQAVDLVSPPASPQITLIGQNLNPADAVTFITPGISDPIPGNILGIQSDGSQLIVELPGGLRPGVNTVTLTHYSAPSSPPGIPPGPPAQAMFQSNAAPFILRPTLDSISYAGGTITAVVSPTVGPNQRIYLLLNQIESSPAGSSAAFQLAGTAGSPPDSFNFPITMSAPGTTTPASVPPGNYLVRVRVDDAESRLETDPSLGAFSGPIVTIA
jgi:hypothetical protein